MVKTETESETKIHSQTYRQFITVTVI